MFWFSLFKGPFRTFDAAKGCTIRSFLEKETACPALAGKQRIQGCVHFLSINHLFIAKQAGANGLSLAKNIVTKCHNIMYEPHYQMRVGWHPIRFPVLSLRALRLYSLRSFVSPFGRQTRPLFITP